MFPLVLATESAEAGIAGHDLVIVSSSLLVVLVLLVTAVVARAQLGMVPRGLGAVYEHIFDWVDGVAAGFMGKEGRTYVPLAMSFFLFILFSNWIGLIPLPRLISVQEGGHIHHIPPYESPSSSYSVTLALAIMAFLAFNLLGLKKRIFPPAPVEEHVHTKDAAHKDSTVPVSKRPVHAPVHHNPGGLAGLWQWIGHFWQPTPQLWRSLTGPIKYCLVPILFFFFLGLNFIEEWARILSLSLRLYGNIYGEHAATANILQTMFAFLSSGGGMMLLTPLVWVASIIVTLLGGLAGFIQAMVFMMLLLSYVGHAVADEH